MDSKMETIVHIAIRSHSLLSHTNSPLVFAPYLVLSLLPLLPVFLSVWHRSALPPIPDLSHPRRL